MLKMLVLKMVKKYINIYKYKLSLWQAQNKQKALFSLRSLKQNNFQKYKKKKKIMLDVIRTYNNSNYKLT